MSKGKDYSQLFSSQSLPKSTRLIHYTSLDALTKIIETKQLWFTNADYVNDISEGQYLKDLFNEVLREFEKNNNCPADLVDFLHKEYIFRIDETYLKSGDSYLTGEVCTAEADVYIACFSTEDDSLPMWHYYVGNGQKTLGVNIEFNSGNLFELSRRQRDIEIVQVIYSIEEQKELLNDALNLLLSEWETAGKSKNVSGSYFADFLQKMRYACKNPCFSYENEVRFILKKAQPDKKDICYRSNGILIPYIKVPINICNGANITLSALGNFDLAKQSLQSFLEKNEIVNCNIKKSKCPIRW